MIKQQLSLLHIEDDSLWQVTLAQAFRALPSVASVTSVATGLAGLARVQSDRPDLVVLDAVLPDCDGLGLIAQIAESSPHTRVLLLSARRDEFILFSATQPHVAGLLCKSEGVFAQLAVAIQSVAAGEKYFSLEVRETLRRFRGDPKAFYKLLSPRWPASHTATRTRRSRRGWNSASTRSVRTASTSCRSSTCRTPRA